MSEAPSEVIDFSQAAAESEANEAVSSPVSEIIPESKPEEVKKKPSVKKANKPKSQPTQEKKKPAKKVQKTETTSRTKKEGLRAGQVRILKLLVKREALSRAEIAKQAPVDFANCVELIGSHDDEKRTANDAKHYPSLLTLGLVKSEQHDVNGRNVMMYRITAKGKTQAAKL